MSTADDAHFKLRIPEKLRAELKAAAAANRRSLTAEILRRLDESVERDALGLDVATGVRIVMGDEAKKEQLDNLERLEHRHAAMKAGLKVAPLRGDAETADMIRMQRQLDIIVAALVERGILPGPEKKK